MKLSKLVIPEGFKNLRPSALTSLSDIVLLAGPNGGGKSRVLDAVRSNGRPETGAGAGERRGELHRLKSHLRQVQANLASLTDQPADSVSRSHSVQESDRLVRQIEEYERELAITPLIEPDPVPSPVIVDLSSATVSFSDSRSATPTAVGQAYEQIRRRLSLQKAIEQGPAAIFGVLANAGNESFEPEERKKLQAERERLNAIAESLLGATFTMGRYEDGPQIFGHPLESAQKLSAGQRILLALVYLLYFQSDADKDVIILWDEPENHLHPDAAIQIVERIRQTCPQAQLWIATHSIHLLAHFEAHGIWFVRNGEVKRGGRVAERVLSSLIGEEEHIDKLSEFLALPRQRALREFAAKCLVPPGTLDTGADDPQTSQVFNYLVGRAKGDELRVLDYGAGKGRLLSELIGPSKDEAAQLRVEYFAYDKKPCEEDQESVNRYLRTVYGDEAERYRVGESKEVLEGLLATFDVVVLCNALHEIDPTEWMDIFGPHGSITSSLCQGGSLLLVEDYVLAAGERAHRFGFLLLDKAELALLFDVCQEEIQTIEHPSGKYRSRLKMHVIPKSALEKMTHQTLLAALCGLRDRTYADSKLHHENEDNSAEAGHAFAVSAHQHLNALLAIDALKAELAGASHVEPGLAVEPLQIGALSS